MGMEDVGRAAHCPFAGFTAHCPKPLVSPAWFVKTFGSPA